MIGIIAAITWLAIEFIIENMSLLELNEGELYKRLDVGLGVDEAAA